MGLSDVVGAVGYAVGGAAADVATELTSFTEFRRRVDELIRDLKRSPADAERLGQGQLASHQFGGEGEWTDAAGVFAAYRAVIKELEDLSSLLSDSMEGMSIAVLASHKGYANIDADIRDRVSRIYAETARHYADHRRHGDDRDHGDDRGGNGPHDDRTQGGAPHGTEAHGGAPGEHGEDPGADAGGSI